jgi:hypothetical protein
MKVSPPFSVSYKTSSSVPVLAMMDLVFLSCLVEVFIHAKVLCDEETLKMIESQSFLVALSFCGSLPFRSGLCNVISFARKKNWQSSRGDPDYFFWMKMNV